MPRDTRPFDLQFQWEVDKIVFRHRQSGVPVEVSAAERDYYQAVYTKRFRSLGRVMSNSMLGCAALTIVGLFGFGIGPAAYLLAISALISPTIMKFDATGWFLLAVCGFLALLLVIALLAKGAQHERNRLRRESGQLIDRARRLGQD